MYHSPKTGLMAVLLSAVILTPGLAAEDNGGAPAGDPCMVEPDDETETGKYPVVTTYPQNLTAMLDRCDGVLEPPPVGDAQFVEPAPEAGVTPVIPPGTLPDDQPPPADSIE